MKLVFFPASEALTRSRNASPDTSRSARKRLATSFRRFRKLNQPSIVEMVSSRRHDRKHSPALGRAVSDSYLFKRAIYLETFGAAIVSSLTDAQAAALVRDGATIVDNELSALNLPFSSAGGSLDQAAALARSWHMERIGIKDARRKGLTGRGVTIGIADSGIDRAHDEFIGKKVAFRTFSFEGVVQKSTFPIDYHGHGTQVASAAAGVTIGVAPGADLAVAAVLTRRDGAGNPAGYTTQVMAGLNWLATGGEGLERKVDILNISLGTKDLAGEDYQKIGTFRDEGVLVVAAIGNDGALGIGHHRAPASFDCVIGVGATDQQDHVAPFSAWGPTYSEPKPSEEFKPDLLAPGAGIPSAAAYSEYCECDGTSLSCAIVAGAASLLIEKDESLRRNANLLTQKLFDLTKNLPMSAMIVDRRKIGRGRIDLSSI